MRRRAKKVILLIMDGWGLAKPDKYNAIDNAQTPNFDHLYKNYPHMKCHTYGEYVGLPNDQFGTSEANHMTIGCGIVYKQDLLRINKSLEDKSFYENEQLHNVINHCKKNGTSLHLTGIVSDGGVHTHINHLYAILDTIKNLEFKGNVFIHAFTDGRDTPPKSAKKYLTELDKYLKKLRIGEIATLQGRYYLDRDRDWDKTEKAAQLILRCKGQKVASWQEALKESYAKMKEVEEVNDQYHKQYVINDKAIVKPGDSLICFHFRTDRSYQLLKYIQKANIQNLYFTSFIKPSESLKYNPLFERPKINMPLSVWLRDHKKKQYHSSETEKFPHVTYFFNGEAETELRGEKWLLIESNRFVKPMYNFEPSMRVYEITKLIIENIQKDKYDFQIINFAQTDMVGHTGEYEAAVIAAESVDYCLGKIYEIIKDRLDDYTWLITADHGNSEEMWDYKNNQPHTQHTFNDVPLIFVDKHIKKLKKRTGVLNDITPSICKLMGLRSPPQFTGEELF